MQKSEQINELAKALCEAQKEMKPATKDAKNPFFKSDYATLESVAHSSLPILNKHGLSISQATSLTDSGGTVLETIIMHISGQWLCGEYPIHPTKNDPQSSGSALTYARRYTWAAIAGVVTADDDAEAAMNRDAPERAIQTQRQVPGAKVSEAQVKRLYAIAKKSNWAAIDVANYLSQIGVKAPGELNYMQYEGFCQKMEKFPKSEYKNMSGVAQV